MKNAVIKSKYSIKKYYILILVFILNAILFPGCKKNEKDCAGWAVYGPRPCSTDEECVKEYGDGWYCNTEHAYTNPCGEKIPWPLCEQKK